MKIFFVAFLFFLTAFACAQRDANPDNLRAKIFELSVKTVPEESLKLPFQAIKIIDSRPDTSKLGFRLSRRLLVAGSIFEKIVLSPGIEKGIETFYNEYYKHNFTPNGKVLLISIKKLWINNVPDSKGENQRKDIDRVLLSQQDIYAKFEYYLGLSNVYFPMKRTDTVFKLTTDKKVEDYDPKDENKLPFFCFALEKMIENVNYSLYTRDLDKKKEMAVEDIRKYNITMKNTPILNEPIKKGVFLSFSEFKNNQPSVTSFTKRKMPNRKIYEIDDEKGNVILDYFACYDGEKLAVAKHFADLLATRFSQDNPVIYRVNDSFQFFENYFHYPDTQPGTGSVGNAYSAYSLVRVPRQIDMDTGEIY